MESDSDVPLILEDIAESTAKRWKRFCRLSIEPALFLVFFGTSFTSVVSSNQIIKTTCTTIYEYNETLCDQLGTSDAPDDVRDIEKIIQPYVARILMISTISGTIGPCLTGAFFGAWSDKFGRKLLMLLTLGAYLITSILMAIFTFVSTVCLFNPWIFLSANIPISLVGGMCSLLGCCYCYISDITSEKQRPFKMALIGLYLTMGMLLGNLSCTYALPILSPTIMFLITSTIQLMAFIYVKFFVRESLDRQKLQTTSKIKGLFQLSLAKDMIHTLIKRRENYNRLILWVCIVTLCLNIFAMEGASQIFYLFVREKFSWTAENYTFFNTITIITLLIGGGVTIVLFQRILGVPELWLILIGYGSGVLENVVKLVATESWHLYLAMGISAAKVGALPMCRSMIATVVPKDEIGKVYSIATVLEFMAPIGSAPLYTYLYNSTLEVFSGAFNALTAGAYFICFLLFAVVFGLNLQKPTIAKQPDKRRKLSDCDQNSDSDDDMLSTRCD